MTKEKDIIRLGGRKYHGETGQLIKDAANAPLPKAKKPVATSTLNRQYVHKPDIRRAAGIKARDNRAQKPEIKQFNRDIIVPGKQGPKAPNVSRFKRGDFNKTDQPIILDVKPNKDVIVTAEQNQKFIEAVERAKRVDSARRYYAAQISRQRRRKTSRVYQTSQNLAQKAVRASEPKTPPAKLSQEKKIANQRAKKDQAINRAIAATPSNSELAKTKPTKVSLKTWTKRHTKNIMVAIVLIAAIAGLFYLNWPNIAIKLASNQLGIETHLPAHTVNGFRLSGSPVVSDYELILKYVNDGGQDYRITQAKSALDSQGVLTKVVKPIAGDNFSIHRQNGLTIYVFEQNETRATWSNGGVLYQIFAESDFPLENIYRLATSL